MRVQMKPFAGKVNVPIRSAKNHDSGSSPLTIDKSMLRNMRAIEQVGRKFILAKEGAILYVASSPT
jgi:hypothetical protein